ncbi:MAG: glycosyltransferase 61 family protein, partial [Synechococcales bacterium]|nr:glycosyltransferase 61 family protein [Synechococcales bacterium]
AAIASYQCAIALEPEMILAYLNLAAAWQQYGQPQTALALIQEALRHEPDHLAALDQSVSLALQVGEPSQALISLHRMVVQQSQWIAAYCHLSGGEPQVLSSESLGQSFHESPGDSPGDSPDRLSNEASDDSSPRLDDLTLSQQACGRFLSSLQATPLAPQTVAHLVDTLVHLGHALHAYGALQQAEVYYRRALLVQPQNADLYRYLGDMLRRQQRENAAVLIYQAGLSLAPRHAGLTLALAQSAAQRERWDVAAGYYRQVIQLQPWGQLPHDLELLQGEALTSHPAQQSQVQQSQVQQSLTGQVPIQGVYLHTRDWAAATSCPCTYRELTAAPAPSHPSTVIRGVIPIDPSPPPQSSSCGGITCGDCSQRLMGWFPTQSIRPGIERLDAPSSAVLPAPPRFTVTIPNGRAWIAPQRNHWQVCHSLAILTPDGYLLGDLSRDYPWYLPGCDRYNFNQHHVFTEPSLPPIEEIDGTVAVLSGLSGHVYYHWMVDILPRWDILQRCGIDFATVDYVVVNSDRAPFQRATLAALGLSADRILTSDCHPHLQAKTLVVPSFPGALTWASSEAIAWLRHTFLPLASGDRDWPRQIYIRRAAVGHRRVLNEAEVLAEVQRWGFVPVTLETLSLGEQIALFAQATAIVAPHGAGLTNVIFCQPETRLLELVSPYYVRPEYPAITQHLGLIHYQMRGAALHGHLIRQLMYQSPVTEDLWVNREILQMALEVMMENAPRRAS